MPPRTSLSSCPGREGRGRRPALPVPGAPARPPQRAVGRWTSEAPGTPAAGRSGRWSVLIAHHLLPVPTGLGPVGGGLSALRFPRSTDAEPCQYLCQVLWHCAAQAIGLPRSGARFASTLLAESAGALPFRATAPAAPSGAMLPRRGVGQVVSEGNERRRRAPRLPARASSARAFSLHDPDSVEGMELGSHLATSHTPRLSGRGYEPPAPPRYHGCQGQERGRSSEFRKNSSPRARTQPVPCTSSRLSSWKASWRARTASSTRSFLMMQVRRISLVEIISMLMPCSYRVRNMRAAYPGAV